MSTSHGPSTPDDTNRPLGQDGPINLTEIAEGMSWRRACETLRVDLKAQTAGLNIQPLDDGHGEQSNDGTSDTIYFVISGYGVLQCEDKAMQCTAGDVLFIPRGHPHRFERMDGVIRIWMIKLAQQP